jgi:hypothetical protein
MRKQDSVFRDERRWLRDKCEIWRMKNAQLTLLALGLLTACGRNETDRNTAQSTNKGTPDSVAAAATPAPKPCESVVKIGQLGKANVYQESAKGISVTLTLEQDNQRLEVGETCYANNSVTVLAAKKSGSRVFKRTFTKADLLYFTKNDQPIEQGVLQSAIYKPTFNAQKYITVTMRLLEPVSKKTTDYTAFLNYYGEITNVR